MWAMRWADLLRVDREPLGHQNAFAYYTWIRDSIATNMFVLGYAYQKGLIPLAHETIERAIELNGAAVPMNLAAFRWGRRAAADRAAVEKLAAPPASLAATVVPFTRIAKSLD